MIIFNQLGNGDRSYLHCSVRVSGLAIYEVIQLLLPLIGLAAISHTAEVPC